MKKLKPIIILGILALLCFSFQAKQAHAAIVFDTSSTFGGAVQNNNGSITIGHGENEILVISFEAAAATTACTSPTITVNNVAAQLAVPATSTTNNRYSGIYYALNQKGTVSVTSTCPVSTNQGLRISSWFGVSQVTPIDASSSKGVAVANAAVTTNITTLTKNDVLVDAVETRDALKSAGASQVVISTSTAGVADFGGASYKRVAATGTVAMAWTINTAQTWSQSIVALKPATVLPVLIRGGGFSKTAVKIRGGGNVGPSVRVR